MNRRSLLRSAATLGSATALLSQTTVLAQSAPAERKLGGPEELAGESMDWQKTSHIDPVRIARDESYWTHVASHFDSSTDMLNLEHGYWGKMARPVEARYLEATQRVNRDLSRYARRDWPADMKRIEADVALALGVAAEEIVLTRNATEAFQDVLRQYSLRQGGAVLYADIDYPDFKPVMQWLARSVGGRSIRLELPERASSAQLLDCYVAAMEANRDLALMLVTHTSNQHGLTLPVREITAAARARGIDVVCDAAQSWGLLDFTLPQLGVDWAVFNLHKWIGAPLGVGALYLRGRSMAKIRPNPAAEPDDPRTAARVHTGTVNFAAVLAVTSALQFHRRVGAAAKEQRLRHLHALWSEPASSMRHIEVLGGTQDTARSGMGAFRMRGETSVQAARQVQQRLEQEFGIFTVMRDGLAGGGCIRVTPQIFTTPAQLQYFVQALERLA